MLIAFCVCNYKTFRREAELLMTTRPNDRAMLQNTRRVVMPGLRRLLLSSAIYGANGSGKTNFISALSDMRGAVIGAHEPSPKVLELSKPFSHDASTLGAPSLFEIIVLIDGVRYQYGLEVAHDRVESEWLIVCRKKQSQRWFVRTVDPETGDDSVLCDHDLSGYAWLLKDLCTRSSLALSVLANEGVDEVLSLYNWIENLLVVRNGGEGLLSGDDVLTHAPLLRDIIHGGKTLIVDDIDKGLHMVALRHIVRAFHDPELNRNGAQIIFSTHNGFAIDDALMRQDQIWFVEKGVDKVSCLVPLSDFKLFNVFPALKDGDFPSGSQTFLADT
jgi:hypothetical protein